MVRLQIGGSRCTESTSRLVLYHCLVISVHLSGYMLPKKPCWPCRPVASVEWLVLMLISRLCSSTCLSALNIELGKFPGNHMSLTLACSLSPALLISGSNFWGEVAVSIISASSRWSVNHTLPYTSSQAFKWKYFLIQIPHIVDYKQNHSSFALHLFKMS